MQGEAKAVCAGGGAVEVGGRVFVCPAMSGPHWMAVRNAWREQVMATAKDPLTVVNERISAAEKAGRPFSPTVVESLVKSALSASARAEGKSEPSEQEILAQADTVMGGRFLVWYRLRLADPTVTQQWVAEHVPDMDAVYALTERFARADGLKDLDPKKA